MAMLDAVRRSAAATAAGRSITAGRTSSTASTDADRTLLERVARQSGTGHVRLRSGRWRPTRQQTHHHRRFYVLTCRRDHCGQLSVFIASPLSFASHHIINIYHNTRKQSKRRTASIARCCHLANIMALKF